MDWQKKYHWMRTWGNETGINGKPHEDYAGYSGEIYIGRIYYDEQTLKSGQWRWAASAPRGMVLAHPHNGWAPTPAEAAKLVEEHWDASLATRDRREPPVPKHVEEYKGYRIAVYSPRDHHAVITPPGSNAVMDFGDRQPRSTSVEGVELCLDRAKALIDELTMEVSD